MRMGVLIRIMGVVCAGMHCCCFSVMHQAHLAGSWYPHDRAELHTLLQKLNQDARERFDVAIDGAQIRALVVPHAGLIYSGAIAMAAYRLVQKSGIDRVILIAPSHTMPITGAAVASWTGYALPSGDISFDVDAIRQLAGQSLFQINDTVFAHEHAIEVQLPFIRECMPHAKIVPIIVGTVSAENVDALARVIKPFISARTLVVVTSDLIHYGAQFQYTPFKTDAALQVQQLDAQMLWLAQQHDRAGLRIFFQKTGATVCGQTPLDILCALIEQNVFGSVCTRLIAYGNSLAVTGKSDSFVSYASLMVSTQLPTESWSTFEKNMLVQYARDVLRQSFKNTIDASLLKPLMTPLLQHATGVFVTLYKQSGVTKSLRGCIGRIITENPVWQTVADMVIAAAHDPRFEPVRADELDALRIEISVLTKPRPVKSYHDIVLNKHGIILTVGTASAIFLPKVPQEYGFDLQQTLSELSKKAGLAENAWQSAQATFQVFEATTWSE